MCPVEIAKRYLSIAKNMFGESYFDYGCFVFSTS